MRDKKFATFDTWKGRVTFDLSSPDSSLVICPVICTVRFAFIRCVFAAIVFPNLICTIFDIRWSKVFSIYVHFVLNRATNRASRRARSTQPTVCTRWACWQYSNSTVDSAVELTYSRFLFLMMHDNYMKFLCILYFRYFITEPWIYRLLFAG